MGTERPEPTLSAEILKLLNRRIPNGTYGGVRGRSFKAPPTRLQYTYNFDFFVILIKNEEAAYEVHTKINRN